jgi:hypothetical protein
MVHERGFLFPRTIHPRGEPSWGWLEFGSFYCVVPTTAFRDTSVSLLRAAAWETYLNTVYLAQVGDVPVYGLPAAAQQFLGKDVGASKLPRQPGWPARFAPQ